MTKASENTLSLDTFSPEAKALMGQAQKFADANKHPLFEPAHLLAVLLDVSEVIQVFKDLGVNTVLFCSQLHGYLNKLSKSNESSSLAPSMINFIGRVKVTAEKKSISTFDLLVGLSQENQGITANLFKQFNITPERLRTATSVDKVKSYDLNACPYFTNLSDLAKNSKLDPIIGRDQEVRRLIQILGRQSKNHPLLVGEAGVGKRTIVLAFVDRINSKNVPRAFKNVLVVQLNTSKLLAGATNRLEIEERLNTVLKYLNGYSAIIYVRSLEALMSSGLKLNLNDMFGSMFTKHNVRVIAACSPDTLKKVSETEVNLIKEFTVFNIESCTTNCAVEVLRGVAARYEKHHNIKIGETAINTAVKLAKRYVQDRFLPESAIDLLDEAASNKKMEVSGVPIKLDMAMSRLASVKQQLTGLYGDDDDASARAREVLEKELYSLNNIVNNQLQALEYNSETESEVILTEESIALVLGEWTGIPINKFLEGETEKLTKMEERLCRRVVGQNEAIQAVSKSVRRSYSGLRDNGKPIGSFLFLGASGTGKTELAKALAEFLFDDEQAITRIDMSEFMEKHMAQRLVGAPPGYQGAEEGGFLTEAVRRKPYSVLLFDEVEKAHPDVFNLLLQVLDDGRLTDGRGRTADFSNTIVIMTSNIGSKKILDTDRRVFESEEGRANLKNMLHDEMKAFLRPEFINRIDETVIFRPLAKEQLAGILDIQLLRLHKLLADREISIKMSEEAKRQLVDIGYEPAYGARPLKRAIIRHVQDPLAEAMVKGLYKRGAIVRISFSRDHFIIEN